MYKSQHIERRRITALLCAFTAAVGYLSPSSLAASPQLEPVLKAIDPSQAKMDTPVSQPSTQNPNPLGRINGQPVSPNSRGSSLNRNDINPSDSSSSSDGDYKYTPYVSPDYSNSGAGQIGGQSTGSQFPSDTQIPEFGKPLPSSTNSSAGSANGDAWTTNRMSNQALAQSSSAEETRITRLEQQAFGSTYPEHEVDDRLDHLEKEIFGGPTQAAPQERLAKLEQKLGMKSAFGQTPNANTLSQGSIPQKTASNMYPPRTSTGNSFASGGNVAGGSNAGGIPGLKAETPQMAAVPPPAVPQNNFSGQQNFTPQSFPGQNQGQNQQLAYVPPQQSMPAPQAGFGVPSGGFQQQPGFSNSPQAQSKPWRAGGTPSSGVPQQQQQQQQQSGPMASPNWSTPQGSYPTQSQFQQSPQYQQPQYQQPPQFQQQQFQQPQGQFQQPQYPAPQYQQPQYQQPAQFQQQQPQYQQPAQYQQQPPQYQQPAQYQQPQYQQQQPQFQQPQYQQPYSQPQQFQGQYPAPQYVQPPQYQQPYGQPQFQQAPAQQPPAQQYPPYGQPVQPIYTSTLPSATPQFAAPPAVKPTAAPKAQQAMQPVGVNPNINQTDYFVVVKGMPYDEKAGDYAQAIWRPPGIATARFSRFPIKIRLPQSSPESWRKYLDETIKKWGSYIPLKVAGQNEPADIELTWENHFADNRLLGITRLQILQGHMQVRIYLLRPTFYPPDVPERILKTVSLHEVGHAVGLFGHSDSPQDVMYAGELFSGKGKAALAKPGNVTQRDLNTLKKMYECPPMGANVSTPKPMEWSCRLNGH